MVFFRNLLVSFLVIAGPFLCFSAREDEAPAALAVVAPRSAYACVYARTDTEAGPLFQVLVAKKKLFWTDGGVSKGISNNPGQHVFPGGGIKPEESPAVAARREFNEETGVDLPGGQSVTKTFDYRPEVVEAGELPGQWNVGSKLQKDAYAALYTKISISELNALVQEINKKISANETESSELNNVQIKVLGNYPIKVPKSNFTSLCTKNHLWLSQPKSPEGWGALRAGKAIFWGSLSSNPIEFRESWRRGGGVVQEFGVEDFFNENYGGVGEYVSGIIDGSYNSPDGDIYSIVRGYELYPSRFCTDWFSEIAKGVVDVDAK